MPDARALPGLRADRERRALARRHARVRARGTLRDASRRVLRGDDSRPSAGDPRRSARRAGLLRVEGVPERRRLAPPRRGGRSARTCPRSASSRSRARPGSPASSSSCTATRSRTRSSAPRPKPGATVVLDGYGEPERAATAGVRRVLVRVTLGVEADTHEAIRTGHHGSKFGLPPDDCPRVSRRRARARSRRRRAPRPRRLAARRPRRARGDDRAPRGLRRALPRRARLDSRRS